MRNQIKRRDFNPFGFDLRPLFDAYTASVKYSQLPSPSGIIDLYDEIIKMNLDSIDNRIFLNDFTHYSKPLSGHLNELLSEEIEQINKELNMKINLHIPDVVVILDYYFMFYKDDYGQCFNMPAKEVW